MYSQMIRPSFDFGHLCIKRWQAGNVFPSPLRLNIRQYQLLLNYHTQAFERERVGNILQTCQRQAYLSFSWRDLDRNLARGSFSVNSKNWCRNSYFTTNKKASICFSESSFILAVSHLLSKRLSTNLVMGDIDDAQ